MSRRSETTAAVLAVRMEVDGGSMLAGWGERRPARTFRAADEGRLRRGMCPHTLWAPRPLT